MPRVLRRDRIKRGQQLTQKARSSSYRNDRDSSEFTQNNSGKNSDEYSLTSICVNKTIDQMFPDRWCCKMKNSFSVLMAGTGGAAYGFSLQANCLHNPVSNVVTGAAPLSGANATAIYGLGNLLQNGLTTGPYLNYRIIATKVVLTCTSPSASSGVSGTIVLFPVTSSAAGTLGNISSWNLFAQKEQPYATTLTISGQSINRAMKLRNYNTTHRMYGLKYKAQMESPEFAGVAGTNPTNVWNWVMSWFPLQTTTIGITAVWDVEYTVEFFNRQQLANTSV